MSLTLESSFHLVVSGILSLYYDLNSVPITSSADVPVLSQWWYFFLFVNVLWNEINITFRLHFLSFNSGFFSLACLHISSCCHRAWVRGGEREISIQFLSVNYIKFLGFPTRSMHTKGTKNWISACHDMIIWKKWRKRSIVGCGHERTTFSHITFSEITFSLGNDKGKRFIRRLKEHAKS